MPLPQPIDFRQMLIIHVVTPGDTVKRFPRCHDMTLDTVIRDRRSVYDWRTDGWAATTPEQEHNAYYINRSRPILQMSKLPADVYQHIRWYCQSFLYIAFSAINLKFIKIGRASCRER